MIRIFAYCALKDSFGEQKTKELVEDFRAYKEGRGLPITFGRDVPYNFTHNRSYLELQHLHFNENGFPFKQAQFRRTSGYILVYCSGFTARNIYLLIAITKHWNQNKPDDTDGTDRDSTLMNTLEKIAENFRENF